MLYSLEEIKKLEEKMVQLGPRLTGSKAHNEFISIIKEEIKKIGLVPKSDVLMMKKRWEPKRWKLSILEDGVELEIPDVTYYPYSGETPPEGITGKMLYCGRNNIGSFLGSNDKIALVEMSIFEAGVGLVFKKRSTFPEEYMPPRKLASPVVSSFINAPMIWRAKMMGAKGVICIMRGCSDENAAYQYLPFITSYKGIPALWVNSTQGKILRDAEKRGAEVNLTLEAITEENVPTENVYAILKGKNDKETIMINTHTDGTNAFEENGPVAILSLMRYFASIPIEFRERTLVFSFVTGHFQLPQFGSPANQATNRFLRKHKELWSGKNRKAVAGLSIEHLGCTEWRDSKDKTKYEKVSEIDPELVFVANKELDKVYLDACKERKHAKVLTLKPKNLLYFGEGQPMYIVGIPTISIVPGPDYLCTNSPTGYLEKINYNLMEEQIDTCKKVVERLDKMSAQEIGRSEIFTYGFNF